MRDGADVAESRADVCIPKIVDQPTFFAKKKAVRIRKDAILRVFNKFILRRKRQRVLRALNEANIFKRIQQENMSPEQIEKSRRGQQTAHRRQEWRDTTHVLNLHENAPDSDGGLALLSSLEAGDIHYLASMIAYDGNFDEAWALAFLHHPKCDLGTAWLLFLGYGSPMIVEDYLRKNEGAENPFGHFSNNVERNDAILARMKAGDFASRNYAPADPQRINKYKNEVEAALSEGKSIRWNIPDDAYSGLKGLEAKTRYEKFGDDVFEDFETWLAKNNPDQ